jgi:hypothetical protein
MQAVARNVKCHAELVSASENDLKIDPETSPG